MGNQARGSLTCEIVIRRGCDGMSRNSAEMGRNPRNFTEYSAYRTRTSFVAPHPPRRLHLHGAHNFEASARPDKHRSSRPRLTMQEPAAHGLLPRRSPPSITRYAARLRTSFLRACIARVGETGSSDATPPGRPCPSALGKAAVCQLGICDDQVRCGLCRCCASRDRNSDG